MVQTSDAGGHGENAAIRTLLKTLAALLAVKARVREPIFLMSSRFTGEALRARADGDDAAEQRS